jgi:hypothetical protein
MVDNCNPPPPQPPNPPVDLHVQESRCAQTEPFVTLVWNDVADNEAGFFIYRNGELIQTLGPNTTTFTDHIGEGQFRYGVEAFNEVGPSERAEVDYGCLY